MLDQDATSKRTVLIAYDGSAGAERAIDVALELLYTAPFVVVAVWESLETRIARSGAFGAIPGDEGGAFDAAELAAATRAVEAAVQRMTDAGREVHGRVAQAQGPVWKEILAQADREDAALILSGSRGRGAVKSALLGSVSHAVLSHSKRPVLIAPSSEEEN